MQDWLNIDRADKWQRLIEYPLILVTFLGACFAFLTFGNSSPLGFSTDPSKLFAGLVLIYPIYSLVRLAWHHFARNSELQPWVGGISDVVYVSLLVSALPEAGLHMGFLFAVLALQALRFNSRLVLASGLIAIAAYSFLPLVLSQMPSFQGIISLGLFATILSVLTAKSHSYLSHIVANKKADREIATARKTLALKSEVISNMSEGLKEPMDSVFSASAALKKTPLSNEQKKYVSVLEDSSQSLVLAIESMLDVSQLKSGSLGPKLEPFNLTVLLGSIAQAYGHKARSKNLDFLIYVDPNAKTSLMGYEKRLHQIISNLVDNAIKFTTDGHVIVQVSCKAIDNKTARLCVKVEDTGCGLTEAQMKAILPQPAGHVEEGSRGLGLKIVQVLLGSQGETLDVERNRSKGTAFSFELSLPYRKDRAEEKMQKLDMSELRRQSVLIVNDDPVEADLLQKQLNALGIMPQIVRDSQAACLAINTAHNADKAYDITLIDYNMPEFDGLKLAELIRSQPELNQMKIIAMSSSAQLEVKAAFEALSNVTYITKPYSSFGLQKALVRDLEQINKRADEAVAKVA